MTPEEAITVLRDHRATRSRRIHATRVLCDGYEALASEAEFLRTEGRKWRAAFHAAEAVTKERANALMNMAAAELVAAANACVRATKVDAKREAEGEGENEKGRAA